MLMCEHEVITALKRYGDSYQPKSGSIILLSAIPAKGGHGHDPFGDGFIDNIDIRAELCARWRRLDERKRMLLHLWYYQGMPVTEISRKLDLSRMHCYRLRKKAIKELVEMNENNIKDKAAYV